MNRPMLTVKEVAALLLVTPEWVRAHAAGRRRPTLPRLKIGGKLRFDPADIELWRKGKGAYAPILYRRH